MGRYMKKKPKTVMDVSEPTALGVRTRAAKALALKRSNDSCSYLQLRSRRLEKPPSLQSDSLARTCNPDHSLTQNSLDFESRFSTRESTPCNLVEDLEIIVTSGSSASSMGIATKYSTRDRDSMVPTTSELEEFFAYAEQQQQRLFMDKYNFDIVNDMPLAGRYKWVQVSP